MNNIYKIINVAKAIKAVNTIGNILSRFPEAAFFIYDKKYKYEQFKTKRIIIITNIPDWYILPSVSLHKIIDKAPITIKTIFPTITLIQ